VHVVHSAYTPGNDGRRREILGGKYAKRINGRLVLRKPEESNP
jgi:hypothetical protein